MLVLFYIQLGFGGIFFHVHSFILLLEMILVKQPMPSSFPDSNFIVNSDCCQIPRCQYKERVSNKEPVLCWSLTLLEILGLVVLSLCQCGN